MFLLKNVPNAFAHRCYFLRITHQLFSRKKKKRINSTAVHDKLYFEYMFMIIVGHACETSQRVVVCLYVLACIWDSSSESDLILVLRSKLLKYRSQNSEMYTDLNSSKEHLSGMPKLGMFLIFEFGLLAVFLDA